VIGSTEAAVTTLRFEVTKDDEEPDHYGNALK